MKDQYFPYILVLPAIVLLLVITIYPTTYATVLAFFEYWLMRPGGMKFIGLGNFQILFADAEFWWSLEVMLYFVVLAIPLEFLIGLVLAILLNREFVGKSIVRTVLIFPMVLTPIVSAMMWRMMFNPTFGVLNYFLTLINLPSLLWISDSSTVIPSLVLVDVWQWVSFSMLILLAGLQSLAVEPFEAAKIDGASRLQVFRYLTLPLLKPFAVVAVIFRVLGAVSTFDIIYGTTEGGPGSASQTLTIYTFIQAFRYTNVGYASAIALVMLYLNVIFVNVFLKRMRVEI